MAAQPLMDAITFAQEPKTRRIEPDMDPTTGYGKYRVIVGQCVKDLLESAHLSEQHASTSGASAATSWP